MFFLLGEMASTSIDVSTKRPTLNPIVRRSFIEQYVKDVQEWKTCAKLIRVMASKFVVVLTSFVDIV
jgi:hypothetical protein